MVVQHFRAAAFHHLLIPGLLPTFAFVKKLFLLFWAGLWAAQPVQGQWQRQASGTDAHFRAVHACSEKTAWVGGTKGTVLRTTDGGLHWEKVGIAAAPTLDFRDIHAFGDSVAVAMSAGEAEKGAARIYRTENGGQSWQLVYETERPGVFLDGLDFWDARNGLCFGDPVDGKFFVLRTTDGGRSWQEVPREAFPAVQPGEAAFAASGTALVVAGRSWAWLGTGGSKHARVFRSNDFGQHWEAIETPLPAGKSSGIFGLRFQHRLRGYAVGGDYLHPRDSTRNVLTTTDGGKNWQLLGSTAPPGLMEAVVLLPIRLRSGPGRWQTRQRLVCVGPEGSGYSDDEGRSWKRLHTEACHAASVAGNALWAVGPKGYIARWEGLLSPKTKTSE